MVADHTIIACNAPTSTGSCAAPRAFTTLHAVVAKAKIPDEVVAREAGALRRLYERDTGPGGAHESMSQARFAQTFDVGSQAMLWQYLTGARPLGLEAATRLARALGCHISDFSPRLAALARDASGVAYPHDRGIDELAARLRERAPDSAEHLIAMLNAILGDAAPDAVVEDKMPATRRRK